METLLVVLVFLGVAAVAWVLAKEFLPPPWRQIVQAALLLALVLALLYRFTGGKFLGTEI